MYMLPLFLVGRIRTSIDPTVLVNNRAFLLAPTAEMSGRRTKECHFYSHYHQEVPSDCSVQNSDRYEIPKWPMIYFLLTVLQRILGGINTVPG